VWENATRALANEDAAHAVEGYRQWLDNHAREGLQSPEAHYNLGLAYWKLKQPGPAIYHILKSATLRRSIPRIHQDLRTLAALEKEIGIKDNLADGFLFQLWLLLNQDITTWLIALAFWAFLGRLLWRWLRKYSPADSSSSWVLAGTSIICLVLAIVATVNRRYLTHVGVLIGDGGIPLYRTPPQGANPDPELKLADLPSGTIVTLGPQKEEFLQITQPVSGWIPLMNIKEVSSTTDGELRSAAPAAAQPST
jgi:hypothetical protein